MCRNLGIRTNLGETKAKEIWFKRTHMVIIDRIYRQASGYVKNSYIYLHV